MSPGDGMRRLTNNERRQLLMMRNEDLWPSWPQLKLRGVGDKPHGFLFSGTGPSIFLGVYEDVVKKNRVNGFPHRNGDGKHQVVDVLRFNSFQDIFDAGWRIE